MASPLCILLVDDSEIVRMFVSALLEERGHVVSSIDDPDDIDAALARARPDIVLIDLSFPPAKTERLAQVLRSRPDPVRFAVLSDRPVPELERARERLGAMAYVEKGAGPAIVTCVEALCASG
jgi:DNA-binding NarL/FixJ family response regulator